MVLEDVFVLVYFPKNWIIITFYRPFKIQNFISNHILQDFNCPSNGPSHSRPLQPSSHNGHTQELMHFIFIFISWKNCPTVMSREHWTLLTKNLNIRKSDPTSSDHDFIVFVYVWCRQFMLMTLFIWWCSISHKWSSVHKNIFLDLQWFSKIIPKNKISNNIICQWGFYMTMSDINLIIYIFEWIHFSIHCDVSQIPILKFFVNSLVIKKIINVKSLRSLYDRTVT